jgi:hypothetical protein
MKYEIINGYSVGDVEFKVTKMINSGYQPLGGVSFNRDEYLQAMVKYDNEPSEMLNFPDVRKPHLT